MADPIQFPASPGQGDNWTPTNDIVYVYDGAKWTSLGATVVTPETAAVSATAPANPKSGSLWFDTAAQHLKVFIGGSWKDVRS